MYTQPAAFGSPGHPVSLSVTCPATVGTSDAFAHACHCPVSRLPLGVDSRTAPAAGGIRPPGSTKQRQTKTDDNPASTTTTANRRSTDMMYHTTNLRVCRSWHHLRGRIPAR